MFSWFLELKQRRRRRQRERQNRLRLAKQQICTCITLFVKFLVVTAIDYDVKVPTFTFCRGREPKTTTYFFSSWSLLKSLEFNFWKICKHLTNWTRWNKRITVWTDNSLKQGGHIFWCRFRGCRRRWCLSSLLQTRQNLWQWFILMTFRYATYRPQA